MDNHFLRLSERQVEAAAQKLSDASAVPGTMIQLPSMANGVDNQVHELANQMATEAIFDQLVEKFVGEDSGMMGLACPDGVFRFFVVSNADRERVTREVMGG